MEMLRETLVKIIADDIDSALEKNAEMLSQEFAGCFDSESEVDPAVAKMALKAMRFSTQIALQLMLTYLEYMHVIELPPDGTPMIYLFDKDSPDSQSE